MKLRFIILSVCASTLLAQIPASGQQLFDETVAKQAKALEPRLDSWRKGMDEIALPALSSLTFNQGKILEGDKSRVLKDIQRLQKIAHAILLKESLEEDVLLLILTDSLSNDIGNLQGTLASQYISKAIKSDVDLIMTANWSDHLHSMEKEVDEAGDSIRDAVFAHLQEADVKLGVHDQVSPRAGGPDKTPRP